MIYILLVLSLISNALANVFIKAGMRDYTGSIVHIFHYLFKSPLVLAGLLLFGLAFIGYSFVLSRLELSIAYPIMTGAGFAIVSIFSFILFNESFGTVKIIGIIFVFIGIILLSR